MLFKLLAFISLFFYTVGAVYGQNCGSPPSTATLGSGAAAMQGYENWCRSKGGRIVSAGGGGIVCSCPTAAGPSTGNSDFGLLGWLFSIDANAKIRAERKAAMIQYLQAQQQDAIRRQQTAQAQKLNGILQRLMSGDMALKGVGGENDLQLKLGGEPILFQEYMSTRATSTTSAKISLKTGDEAIPSPAVSSAGAITTTATTTDTSKAKQPELSPEMKVIAEELSKLSPEQQQELLNAIRGSETQAAANTTVAVSSPEKAADTQLSFKLTEAKTAADNLNAAANAPRNPEEIKSQAVDQFKQLQQVTATQTQTDVSQRPGTQPDTGTKLVDAPKDTGTTQRSTIQAPTKEDVELLFQDVPSTLTGKGTVQAPQNSDLDLLFRDQLSRVFPANEDRLLTAFQRQRSRWPGPVNRDGPLRNPLRDEAQWKIDPAFRVERIQEIHSLVLDRQPTIQEKIFIVDFYGTEFSGRYLSDNRFAGETNWVIDQKIAEARNYLVQANIKSLEKSLSAMNDLIKRYSPTGEATDMTKLAQNRDFLAEKDRLVKSFEAEQRRAYTVDAKVRLGIYLELGFNELKNRP